MLEAAGAREWRLDGEPVREWVLARRRELVQRAMQALEGSTTRPARQTAELQWSVEYTITLFVDLFDDPATQVDEVSAADLVASASNRASEGTAIGSLLNDYMTGAAAIWRSMAAMAAPQDRADFDRVTVLFLEFLRTVLVLVAQGFQHESSRISAVRHDARFAVYSALTEGSGATQVAARAGVRLAPRYLVAAIRLGEPAEHVADGRASAVPRFRRVNAVQRVLAEAAPGEVLSLVSDPTTIALVPLAADQASTPRHRLDALVEQLGRVVGAPVHLGAAAATVHGVPEALAEAEGVLDLVCAIGLPPGAWLLDDVLVPFQLTRPGPARNALVRRLEVLDAHPDWEVTIRTHLASHLDRNRTAAALHVHPNTVDYRLRRFAEVTGLDLRNPALVGAAQAAVWARDLDRHERASR